MNYIDTLRKLERFEKWTLRITLACIVVLLVAIYGTAHAFFPPPDDPCDDGSALPFVCLDGATVVPCCPDGWLYVDSVCYQHGGGDINTDGLINAGDVVVLERMVLGIICPENWQLGDMNGDGALNVGDLLLLQRMVIES